MFFESYYAKEMLAVLVIVSILFVVAAAIALSLLVIDHLQRRILRWSELRMARLVLAAREMLQTPTRTSERDVRFLSSGTVVVIVESVQPLPELAAWPRMPGFAAFFHPARPVMRGARAGVQRTGTGSQTWDGNAGLNRAW